MTDVLAFIEDAIARGLSPDEIVEAIERDPELLETTSNAAWPDFIRNNDVTIKEGEFSVVQFFKTGNCEYVRRFVDLEEAGKVFVFCTTNVAAKHGSTCRVIMTNGGDCVVMEWEYGLGLTFPKLEDQDESD